MSAEHSQDHDILIEVRTLVTVIIQQQKDFFTQTKEMAERISAIEAKDRGDSEKIRASSGDVQRSLENHTRLVSLEGEVGTLRDEMNDIRKKGQIVDAINAIGAIVLGIIGYIFGQR
jgi:uncharacterized protein involved in exopolysaccharide biosynthesis